MEDEDRFLFLATHQQVNSDQQKRMVDFAKMHPIDWALVFKTAEENGVAPLVYSNVMNQAALASQVPDPISKQYKLYMVRNAFYKKERANQLNHAIKFLRERQIAVMVIKGAAQDLLVYDEPWYTVYADIDLVLLPRHDSVSRKLTQEIDDEFFRDQIEYDYFKHHDMSMNGMLPINSAELWQDARAIKVQEEEVYVLSPEDHLLSILINSCRKRFFRLKSLLDITETILRFREINWDKFSARCRKYRCGSIVYTALFVTKTTLGCDVPERVFHQLGVSSLRAGLIKLSVLFLLQFWSLSSTRSTSRIFNRLIDPTLILTYASYRPDQILYKAGEIRGGLIHHPGHVPQKGKRE